jgi:hypothetical protein
MTNYSERSKKAWVTRRANQRNPLVPSFSEALEVSCVTPHDLTRISSFYRAAPAGQQLKWLAVSAMLLLETKTILAPKGYGLYRKHYPGLDQTLGFVIDNIVNQDLAWTPACLLYLLDLNWRTPATLVGDVLMGAGQHQDAQDRPHFLTHYDYLEAHGLLASHECATLELLASGARGVHDQWLKRYPGDGEKARRVRAQGLFGNIVQHEGRFCPAKVMTRKDVTKLLGDTW